MWRFLLLLLAQPAFAEEMRFAFPVACIAGETCHFQNLMDHDPGPGFTDYACGSLGYDGHKGTDIALPSRAAMSAGVDVRAAAPGIVTALRDAAPDIAQGAPDAPDVTGRECGNGIVLDHGGGWETQYCHLARGSLKVTQGQRLEAHDVIGQIGLSGQTEFPHLHFEVRKDGVPIDPFDPGAEAVCDRLPKRTLWDHFRPLRTRPGGVVSLGAFNAVPDYEAVLAGEAHRPVLRPDEPMVLWALFFGGRKGDVVTLSIRGPDGDPVVGDQFDLDRAQAQFYRALGRRAPPEGWAPGQYIGLATLMRDGEAIDSRFAFDLRVAP